MKNSVRHYVYFCTLTGELRHISFKKQSVSGNIGVLEIDSQTASDLKSGKTKLNAVKVIFDADKQKYLIVDKNIPGTQTRSKLCKLYKGNTGDITIEHNSSNACWQITASDRLKSDPPDISNVNFFITEKNDQYRLIRSLKVNLAELYNTSCLSIPFIHKQEQFLDNLDLYKNSKISLNCNLCQSL